MLSLEGGLQGSPAREPQWPGPLCESLLPRSHAHHCHAVWRNDSRFGQQALLVPSHTELARRVAARTLAGLHFMPAALLESQLAILETEGPGVLVMEGMIFTTTCNAGFLGKVWGL